MRGCIPLTQTEEKAIAAVLPLRDRALFVLGCKTGFRISELLSLSIRDVWDGVQVRAAIQVQSQNTKGRRSSQCVALHAEARQALSEYLHSLPKPLGADCALFYSRKGGALDRKSAWRILHSAMLKAGVSGVHRQLGTHCMRKTFAERMHAKLGRDVIKTMQALRHKSLLSTAAYLSFDEEEITQAILSA